MNKLSFLKTAILSLMMAAFMVACEKPAPDETPVNPDPTTPTDTTETPNNPEPEIPVDDVVIPEGLPTVAIEVVETTKSDIRVKLTCSEDFPEDTSGYQYYTLRWAPKSEVEGMTSEDLIERDLKEMREEIARHEDWTLLNLVTAYQILYGDRYSQSLKSIQSYTYNPIIKPGTDYVIYTYAMSISEDGLSYTITADVTTAEARTLDVEMVEGMNFSFSIDRVSPNENGDLMAYFGVESEIENQKFTFTKINKNEVEGNIEDIAKDIVLYWAYGSVYGLAPRPYDEWQFYGYGCTMTEDLAVAVDDNQWYVLAAALDEENNICSEVEYELISVAGLTCTDANIGLSVQGGANGTFTYSTSPDAKALENGYVLFSMSAADILAYNESMYLNNGNPDTYIKTYVNYNLGSDVKTFLSEQEGYQTAAANGSITVTEDTYLMVYTLYEKSGVVQAIDYYLMTPPAEDASNVTITELVIEHSAPYTLYGCYNFFSGKGEDEDGYAVYDNCLRVIFPGTFDNTFDGQIVTDIEMEIGAGGTYRNGDENDCAKRGTVIFTGEEGNYTMKAVVVYEDDSQVTYTYTGPIELPAKYW